MLINAFNNSSIGQAIKLAGITQFIEQYKLSSYFWRGAKAVKAIFEVTFDLDLVYIFSMALVVVFIVGIVRIIIDLL